MTYDSAEDEHSVKESVERHCGASPILLELDKTHDLVDKTIRSVSADSSRQPRAAHIEPSPSSTLRTGSMICG